LVQHVAIIRRDGVAGHVVGGDAEVAFRQNDKFLAGDVVRFDSFTDDGLGVAVRVGVGGVPGSDADFVGVLEEGKGEIFV